MKVSFSKPARQAFKAFPPHIRRKAEKQLRFLEQNLKHPSLHAKKYDEGLDLWQGRVDKAYRFYFTIDGDTYRIHSFKEHPK